MDVDKRASWRWIVVGSALFVGVYLLSYWWCRQGHYLIHRVSWAGDERFHSVTTGDPGNFAGWWYTTTHSVPFVLFAPLRWLEAGWWASRDG
jgi:hypothetical protein